MKEKRGFSCYLIGDASLLIQCGELIKEKGNHIFGVISKNSKIMDWAQRNGLKIIDPETDYLPLLKKEPYDFLFSIVNYAIMSADVLSSPRKMAINFHDALLPEYAGIHATSWAILQNEKKHGITWHKMEEGIDSGNILKQKQVAIEESETAFSLNLKCYHAAIEAFSELLDDLSSSTYTEKQQDLSKRTYFPKNKRPDSACIISWAVPADEMFALMRATDFGGQTNRLGKLKLFVGGDFVIVTDMKVEKFKSNAQSGTIVDINEKRINVATATLDLRILALSTLRGENITLSDFVARYNLKTGDRFQKLDFEKIKKAEELYNSTGRYEDYWIEKLLNLEDPIVQNILKVDDTFENGNYSSVEVKLPYAFTDYIARNSINRFECVFASLAAFLARTGENQSFDIGYKSSDLKNMVAGVEGLFAACVPIRIGIDGDMSFSGFLSGMSDNFASVKKNKTYTPEIFARYPELSSESKSGKNFEPAVVVEQIRSLKDSISTASSGLLLLVPDEGDSCRLLLDEGRYNSEKTTDAMTRFEIFLEGIAGVPDRPLMKTPVLSDDEFNKLVHEWNDTRVEYPREKCVHELFEEQALKTPDSTAVVYEGDSLTYRELNEKSSRLADYLIRVGIAEGTPLGVFMERSLDMMVSLMGILKAGCPYVPLDPIYPKDRLQHMIEDASLPLIITQSELAGRLPDTKAKILDFDVERGKIFSSGDDGKTVRVSNNLPNSGKIAYILFTSGSTGKPKGVEVTHLGLTNYLWFVAENQRFTNMDKFLALTTICFDISVCELFVCLIRGGQVEILPSEMQRDPFKLREKLENTSATAVQATPATWNMLLTVGWEKKLSLKIYCGGEAMPPELADKLVPRCDELWNIYGPTEATIWSSISKIESGENITIGKPLYNNRYYILDKHLNPVPLGTPGELYIGGDGLARGYLNRPEMTAERFIPDPFSKEKGARMYKTGDSVKYLNDGNVAWLGRIDNQVKLHGFRIELGEIETVLKKVDGVQNAIVVLREDNAGFKNLFAFLLAEEGKPFYAKAELTDMIKGFLPSFMIPGFYVYVKSYPLTMNKKIDRKTLASMGLAEINEKFGAGEPVNRTVPDVKKTEAVKPQRIVDTAGLKRDLSEVAAKLMKLDSSDIRLDVPLGEYGYESVSFTVLSMKIKEKFSVNVSPAAFYTYSTIDRLSAHMMDKYRKEIESFYGETVSDAKVAENEVQQTIEKKVDAKIEQKTSVKTEVVSEKPAVAARRQSVGELSELFRKDLSEIAAKLMKLDSADIKSDVPLGEYGYESVSFTVLSMKIKEKFSVNVSPAAFYTYSTIDRLSAHMMDKYRKDIESFYGETGSDAKVIENKGQQTIEKKVDAKIEQKTSVKTEVVNEKPAVSARQQSIGELSELFRKDLSEIAAKLMKLDSSDVRSEVPLGEYGYESVSFTVLSMKIKEKFSVNVSPAAFYTYSTVEKLTAHLMGVFHDEIIKYYGIKKLKEDINDSSIEKIETVLPKKTDISKEKNIDHVYAEKDLKSPYGIKVKEPIAIIGMSGIMPNSPDLDVFWENLKNEVDMISEVPSNRWDPYAYYGEGVKAGTKNNPVRGGFIDCADKFDAAFFSISPREAELMDPQQRLFLECAWKTVEDAGYKPSDLSGTDTGVYVGVVSSDYWDMMSFSHENIDNYSTSGRVNCVIANRISYLFNLHGPSFTLDTACSSSLVALHRAVNDIQDGHCEAAIVGGVNVMSNPYFHVAIGKKGMLSADGKCKTFDKSADGYVRAEGVGAVLIKPLSRAVADGDHVYAVIKSSAENHNGRSNAFTVPSAEFQSDLLVSAYEKAGITPDTVTYIETHGTGTSLGDPIEINSLKDAFSRLYKKAEITPPSVAYCGVGSVKTNIGHLEAGAGIAGLLKLVLSMSNGRMPGNLNFNELNPYIDLEGSPFYLVKGTREWNRQRDVSGNIIPRRAGVSSFGFGGSNAHVVLEEFENNDAEVIKPENREGEKFLIVLSARNRDRLKEYAKNLILFIDRKKSSINLRDLAYTLQTGREAMEERLALTVSSIEELKEKLTSFSDGKNGTDDVHAANIKESRKRNVNLLDGEEGGQFLKIIVRDKKYSKLAQLWLAGIDINWEILYSGDRPRRISLPTYPFERTRHWISVPGRKHEKNTRSGKISALHPFIDSNVSTLEEQLYRKELNRTEPGVKDHVVRNETVFPGAAYLEMARAAGDLAGGKSKVVKLEGNVWLRPMVLGDNDIEASVRLQPSSAGVAYEIFSAAGPGEKKLHSSGRLVYSNGKGGNAEEHINLDVIRKRSQGRMKSSDCYDLFSRAGFQYGPTYRSISELFYNDRESLSRIELPGACADAFRDYLLHPTILDGALQSVIALVGNSYNDTGTIYLPFALQELEIMGPLPEVCYAHAVLSDSRQTTGYDIKKYDIKMTDESGLVILRIKDFSLRAMITSPKEAIGGETKVHYIKKSFEKSYSSAEKISGSIRGRVLLFDTSDEIFQSINERFSDAESFAVLVMPGDSFEETGNFIYKINPSKREDYKSLTDSLSRQNLFPDRIIHYWSKKPLDINQDNLTSLFNDGLYSLFYLCSALLASGSHEKIKLLYAHDGDVDLSRPQYSAMSGFMKSLEAESGKFSFRSVEFRGDDVNTRNDKIANLIAEIFSWDTSDKEILYNSGRFVSRYHRIETKNGVGKGLLKNEGVYLITGGGGALGLLMADYLVRNYGVKIVLVGRSAPSGPNAERLIELEDSGAEVVFVMADVSKKSDMQKVLRGARGRFGKINGVIHCAGVNKDSYLTKKTKEEMDEVISPKTVGTLCLDEATCDEKLDFFAMFSSISGELGNSGQCDYAYANAFMDAFAAYRNGLVEKNERYGMTVSISWPLWKDGGMRVDGATEKLLETALGMVPMESAEGLAAFEMALSSGESHFIVFKGGSKTEKVFGLSKGSKGAFPEINETKEIKATKIPIERAESITSIDKSNLLDSLTRDISALTAAVQKLNVIDIDPDSDISEFGFDSISFTEFSNMINDKFGTTVMPSVFFEHSTLSSLANHLLKEYSEEFNAHYGDKKAPIVINKTISSESVQHEAFEIDQADSDALSTVVKNLVSMAAGVQKLNADDVDPQSDISEFGFDSISFTEFANKINEKYNLEIMPSIFYEHPNLESLARFLFDEYPAAFKGDILHGEYKRLSEDVTIDLKVSGNSDVMKFRFQPVSVREDVVKKTKDEFEANDINGSDEPVAVVGMSGAMPRSKDLNEFWKNIEAGNDLITEIPSDRWDWRDHYGDPAKEPNKTNVKWGGFMDEVDTFDPLFFGISPREAEMMDPQQRIFLQHAWKAVEDSGRSLSDISGSKTGVFIGAGAWDFIWLLKENGSDIQAQTSSGVAFSILANRISYLLNLKGPSETIDTACSSSLVALHRAVEEIRKGMCDMAIAGGINVMVHPAIFISLSKAGMLSDDGKCKTFDSRADGYVRGEGCGVLFLKSLKKAEEDGDNIYAVIKGSSVNHGGHVNSLTTPNPNAQADLIIDAWRKSGIDPSLAGYIEVHGTGTALGDPIEVNGLKKAFKELYADHGKVFQGEPSCGLSSVKTNIGHLEWASGIAGVIKAVLAIKHGKIPASINFNELNPYIQLEGSPFFIADKTVEWERPLGANNYPEPRVAGVSSFGFGGVNAHVVLEEYKNDVNKKSEEENHPLLFLLSARNEERLKEYAGDLLAFIKNSVASVEDDPEISCAVDEVLKEIIKAVSEIMNVDEENIDTGVLFEDFGFEPVAYNSLSAAINTRYNIDVRPSMFSIFSTPESAARNICQQYGSIISPQLSIDSAAFKETKNNVKRYDIDLDDVAYTLQLGRDHMESRLAFTADSVPALLEKLEQYLSSGAADGIIFTGNIKHSKSENLSHTSNSTNESVAKLMERNDLNGLASAWVNGTEIDWANFNRSKTCRRISLPTYPFSREKYWPFEKNHVAHLSLSASMKLHPMLDCNNSDFSEQKFSLRLSGDEFFLKDHVVEGERMLPGVAYLEMARAAGEISGRKTIKKIKDVVWMRPVVMGKSEKDVTVVLGPSGDGAVFTVSATEDDGKIVRCSQGKLLFCEAGEIGFGSRKFDIKGKIADREVLMDRGKCYEDFLKKGFKYGPSFQVINEMILNEDEIVARIELPLERTSDMDSYVLHPSIMDGALQSVAGVMGESGVDRYLPFAAGEVEIFGRTTASCYAVVSRRVRNISDNADVMKFDIAITDDSGSELVRINDFAVRAHLKQSIAAQTVGVENTGLFFSPTWAEDVISFEMNTIKPCGNILLFDLDDDLFTKIRSGKYGKDTVVTLVKQGSIFKKTGDHIYEINPSKVDDYKKVFSSFSDDEAGTFPGTIIHFWAKRHFDAGSASIDEAVETGAFSLINIARELGKNVSFDKIKLLFAYFLLDGLSGSVYSAASGLLKTVNREYPKISCMCLGLEKFEMNIPEIFLSELNSDFVQSVDEIKYSDGKRYKKVYVESEDLKAMDTPFKEKGVYLITGGAGGLGLTLAEFLAKKHRAKLVLAGRNLADDKKKRIDEIEKYGSEIIFIKADVSDREDIERLVNGARSRFGKIDGVIHAAGVLRDSLIAEKTRDDFDRVISPKVFGTVLLDEALKDEKLDFFACFSSIASVLGNSGQSDYSFANGFMDEFAAARNELSRAGKRHGRSISINWPLWKEGGMHVNAESEKLMETVFGVKILDTESGLDAFVKALSSDKKQLVFMKGSSSKIRRLFNATRVDIDKSQLIENIDDERILKKLRGDVISIVSSITKIKEKDIDFDTDMSEFGFDSITFTEFSNRLNEKYSTDITPSAFFEYRTPFSFITHMKDKYRSELARFYGEDLSVGKNSVRNQSTDEHVVSLNMKRFIADTVPSMNSAAVVPEAEAVAIVGIGCVFPQSEDADAFWKNLVDGKDMITEVPPDRWDWREHYGDPARESNKTNVKWGGFISDADKFDPLFFGISPVEAELMDPQQRVFLETAWKTIEDAGYNAAELSGTKTGVFVGVGASDYKELLKESGIDIQAHTSTGTAHSVLANRISYLLDLKGPSEPVDTACSSSLVAVHRAVEAIQNGTCDMALAGGVNILASPTMFISFSKAGMLCEDGRCKTFDKSANGYVRAEGAGAVLLKPLRKAVTDGDNIYAIIKGSAVNHGGHVNSLTTPNPIAQAELVAGVLRKSEVDPSTVGYIEAHGTGTSLGDPIEINGLIRAFSQIYSERGKTVPAEHYCGIGSVKSNMGHLETAAGIAGLIKIVLGMKHGVIPATINFRELNPYIRLEGSPFFIADKTSSWKSPVDENGNVSPRRAGVSSFGFGGSNSHVLLEEYVPIEQRLYREADGPHLIVLSARNEERLKEYSKKLVSYIEKNVMKASENVAVSFTDLAYTLQTGRSHMEARLAVVASGMDEIREKLNLYLDGKNVEDLYEGNTVNNKVLPDIFASASRGKEFIKGLLNDGDLSSVARLWVNGVTVDWKLMHSDGRRRVSLPTYPFARESYWVRRKGAERQAVMQREKVHPVIDANVSSLYEQKFATLFHGSSDFLNDHVVFGKKVLPGSVYIEMARAAGKIAGMPEVRRITEVFFLKPLSVSDDPVEVHTVLTPDEGQVQYKIVSNRNASEVYSQGVLHYENGSSENGAGSIDLDSVKKRCDKKMSPSDCYSSFKSMGLDYGTSFRTIAELHSGENETLARIDIPDKMRNEFNNYVLHPSLIDGALQSVIGVMGGDGKRPYLPFSIEEIELHKDLSDSCYVHVAESADSEHDGTSRTCNIDITDGNGSVLVRLKNFMARTETGFSRKSAALAGSDNETSNISEELSVSKEIKPLESIHHMTDKNNTSLQGKAEDILKHIFSKAINLPVEKIGTSEPFEKYGIDSLMIVNLNRELESSFGKLSKTLLFEYSSIKELAGYLIKSGKFNLKGEEGNEISEIENIPLELNKHDNRDIGFSSRGRFLKPQVFSDQYAFVDHDIAIIGISGKYPMAADLDEFWENLKAGRDCISEIPSDRWDHGLYFDPDKSHAGKSYSKWGGFIDGVDKFDPKFFNISPREAEYMDPQERLFLQTSWHAVEDAGYTRSSLEKYRVGVFVGVMYGQYQLFAAEESLKGNPFAVNSTNASVANRVSYYLNLKGPSIVLDTMCSSSITAIHLACDSLRKGESDAAIAGGVNVTIHPNKYIMLSQGRFTASDGRCRSFGEGGDGYVPGEGVGAVLLKSLKKALSDGDRIYAVIKGSSLNHGGKTNGFSVPSPVAQSDVIAETLKKTGIDPGTISYVEAHGTGTSLGDPIEITGLAKAFGGNSAGQRCSICSIGSVKSNIGHLESAAGISGLTKVILQMKHGKLAPSIHSETLNPNIDFESTPFYVQRALGDWKNPVIDGKKVPRRAGLSSFGAGGSNAHIILEEYEDSREMNTVDDNTDKIFVISARDEERLRVYVERISKYLGELENLSEKDRPSPEEVAHALQMGREAMEERAAFVAPNLRELKSKIDTYLYGDKNREGVFTGKVKKRKLDNSLPDELTDARKIIREKSPLDAAAEWVSGTDFLWSTLYEGKRIRKTSVPTYPFAGERYWVNVSDNSVKPDLIGAGITARLHPLVGTNTSTLSEQKFTTKFNGSEFYFTDHVVMGKKTLPGSAYVEMARAAGELSGNCKIWKLKDIIWSRPVTVDKSPIELSIVLNPSGDIVEFTVCADNNDGRVTAYSGGKILYREADTNNPIQRSFDIASVIKRCSSSVKGAVYGKMFRDSGIVYGPSFDVVKEIYPGKTESLSRLLLPDVKISGFRDFVLHPSIVDGAFRSVIGIESRNKGLLFLPYSIGELEIFSPTEAESYVYAKAINPESVSDKDVRKFDITIMSRDGKITALIKNFTVKAVRGSGGTKSVNTDDEEVISLLKKLYSGDVDVEDVKQLMGVEEDVR